MRLDPAISITQPLCFTYSAGFLQGLPERMAACPQIGRSAGLANKFGAPGQGNTAGRNLAVILTRGVRVAILGGNI